MYMSAQMRYFELLPDKGGTQPDGEPKPLKEFTCHMGKPVTGTDGKTRLIPTSIAVGPMGDKLPLSRIVETNCPYTVKGLLDSGNFREIDQPKETAKKSDSSKGDK